MTAPAGNTVVATQRLAALSDPVINPTLVWPDVFAITPYYEKKHPANDITANAIHAPPNSPFTLRERSLMTNFAIGARDRTRTCTPYGKGF